MPKFLAYFEDALKAGKGKAGRKFLSGARVSYADLSLFQVVSGLRYAFPRTFARAARKAPRVVELAERVSDRPRIVAYLASPRRIPWNDMGIFRYYPELDEGPPTKGRR